MPFRSRRSVCNAHDTREARTPSVSFTVLRARAVSSAGRASALHAEGRRFEPVTAHQQKTRWSPLRGQIGRLALAASLRPADDPPVDDSAMLDMLAPQMPRLRCRGSAGWHGQTGSQSSPNACGVSAVPTGAVALRSMPQAQSRLARLPFLAGSSALGRDRPHLRAQCCCATSRAAFPPRRDLAPLPLLAVPGGHRSVALVSSTAAMLVWMFRGRTLGCMAPSIARLRRPRPACSSRAGAARRDRVGSHRAAARTLPR